MTRRFHGVAFVTPILLLLAAQAAAQTNGPTSPQEAPPAAPPGAAGQEDTGRLQEIIVTAQQRGENLQKAAIPVSVVTGADLQRSGVGDINDLRKNVPALQVTGGALGGLVFIRGVGNFSFDSSTDPAAAFNFDGVYVGRSNANLGTIYDTDRVEVLKGPQGTLYGRNATAGAINVLPVQPSYGELSGYATARYGNYDAGVAEGALNAPVGDNAALRISGSVSRHDGYNDDGTNYERNWSVRGQFKADLSPGLTVRILGNYSHAGGDGAGASYVGLAVPGPGGFTVIPSGLGDSEGLYTSAAQSFRRLGVAGNIPGRGLDPLAVRGFNKNDIYTVQGQVAWQTPVGTVTVIPAYIHSDADGIQANIGQPIGQTTKSDQYSVEARLVSDPGRPIDYNLGVYYFAEDLSYTVHGTAGIVASYTPALYKTRSPSAYGRLTYHLAEALRLTGGIRYTRDKKDAQRQETVLALICTVPGSAGGCPNIALLPYTRELAEQPVLPPTSGSVVPIANGGAVASVNNATSGRLKTSKVTWRAAAEFDVAPRSMLYASVETGYRAGGFNSDSTFDPENITAYTIGSKNRFLDNRLQVNIEGFVWKYRDQQLTNTGLDSRGVPGPITTNAGRSTIKGVEVDTQAQVTSMTLLSADIQYLDTRYDRFRYVPAGPPPFTGCAVTPVGGASSVDCSGKPLVNAPKWTLNLGVQQRVRLGDGFELLLDADTQYRSGRYTSFDYAPSFHVGETWTSNAQVTVLKDNGKWSLSAFVRNIENNRYFIYTTPALASNLLLAYYSPPRTYGLRAGLKF